MTNMRIVSDNASDRVSTLTASSTAGALAASYLLTDIKSEVWRSTATTATLTMTWATTELIGCVCLPFTNLTSTATMRVRVYTNAADTTPLYDTGVQLCCPYVALTLFGWGTQPIGANSYSFGGGTYATLWFPVIAAKKIVIDVSDTSNPMGYVEAGRVVCGSYWESTYNPDRTITLMVADSTKNVRTDGGNLISNNGFRNKTMALVTPIMPQIDRNSLYDVVRNNGMSVPLLVSVFPQSTDTNKEQMYQVFGKLSSIQALTNPFADMYSAPLSIEEV